MAAIDTAQGGPEGTEIYAGARRSIITQASAGDILKATRGKVAKLIVWNVSAAASIDIYDDPAGGANHHVYSWVTADGKVNLDLHIPMANGITVITVATPGATIVWS